MQMAEPYCCSNAELSATKNEHRYQTDIEWPGLSNDNSDDNDERNRMLNVSNKHGAQPHKYAYKLEMAQNSRYHASLPLVTPLLNRITHAR